MAQARLEIWTAIAALVAICNVVGTPIEAKIDIVQEGQRDLGTFDTRIVGGQPASYGQFPYYAAQWWGNPVGSTSSIVICGASLIHSDILLTAAHCGTIANNVKVVVGALYDLSSTYGTLRTVTSRASHPNYSGSPSFTNDLLVLKLNSPVSATPVQLNSDPTSPYNNEQLTITGMGKTSEYASGDSYQLLTVKVNSVDMSTCYRQYLNTNPTSYLNANLQLCSGVAGGGKGFCQGDSGGPVVNSQGVLVGVVSASVGCARANYPGVSSRVSGNINWIRQQVCALSSNPPSYCFTAPTPRPISPTPYPVFSPIATPTLAPVISSGCSDSSTTFNVNNDVGYQGCSWLSINLSRFGYLCKFVDVGRACPLTCNLCGVFAR